jgi:hypothetical protein
LRSPSRPDETVYIIVDAPNGITPVSLPLLRGADVVLMFYRYSVQHVQGTLEAAKKVRWYLLPELEKRYLKILLTGSCFPTDLVEGIRSTCARSGARQEGVAGEVIELFTMIKGIEEKLGRVAELYPEIALLEARIPEDSLLKLREQPLRLNESLTREQMGYSDSLDEPAAKRTIDQITAIAGEVERVAGAVLGDRGVSHSS